MIDSQNSKKMEFNYDHKLVEGRKIFNKLYRERFNNSHRTASYASFARKNKPPTD